MACLDRVRAAQSYTGRMPARRHDEAAWDLQRYAQRRMSVEDRLRQNDAMTRLRIEGELARKRATRA